jgi:hypothetical protein
MRRRPVIALSPIFDGDKQDDKNGQARRRQGHKAHRNDGASMLNDLNANTDPS